jgi:hypothetical protein
MSSKLVIGNVNLFPYTGSAEIEGDLTVTGLLSGTTVSGTFWGDGSNLSGVGGGGGTPGLPLTSVQYNNGGAFAGSANMTFDGTAVTVAGITGSNGAYFADKVGIGTSAPVADLHISGASGVDAFRVDTVGALDNPAIFVDGTNSYVGIGTASPAQGLHVKDNGGGQIVSRIEGSAGRAVLQMDNGANYAFFGASTSGLDFAAGGAGAYSAPLATLKSNGNFGIGETNPQALLDVSGNIAISQNNTALQMADSSAVLQDVLKVDSADNVVLEGAAAKDVILKGGAAGHIRVLNNAETSDLINIDEATGETIVSSSLGIGIPPTSTLHVNGETYHAGGVRGSVVNLSASAGGTVDWDASLGEYAYALAGGAIDIKIINMTDAMTFKLLVVDNGLGPGFHAITVSGSTDGTGTNGTIINWANGATGLSIGNSDTHVSIEMASFNSELWEMANNFYT